MLQGFLIVVVMLQALLLFMFMLQPMLNVVTKFVTLQLSKTRVDRSHSYYSTSVRAYGTLILYYSSK